MSLTGKQRRHLRALAHDLSPVVQIGRGGASESVLRQIDGALGDHELIKVKVAREAPSSAKEVGEHITAKLEAEVAQVIGRMVVVYRADPKEPQIFPDLSKQAVAAKLAAAKVAAAKKSSKGSVRKKTASKWASARTGSARTGSTRAGSTRAGSTRADKNRAATTRAATTGSPGRGATRRKPVAS